MIEVEIKIPISDPGRIAELLLQNGFCRQSLLLETDQYFNKTGGDFRKTDEALRIRTSKELPDGPEVSCITYKGKKLDQISMTRPEYETSVADAKTAAAILEHLGFYKVMPVVKKRAYYEKMEILQIQTQKTVILHACLDNVEGLGDFLELEIMIEETQDNLYDREVLREAALLQIRQMLASLGLAFENTTTISYLSMLEAKLCN